MAKNTFFMFPQKQGRMKYLLLTVGSSLLLMYLFLQLFEIGILPKSRVLTQLYIYLPMAVMMVLGYHLIMKKNHSIEVRNNTIQETDWRRQALPPIKTAQIYCYRQNLLKEIILLDNTGNTLLCVESNMTNFDQFTQWLVTHNITQSKEK